MNLRTLPLAGLLSKSREVLGMDLGATGVKFVRVRRRKEAVDSLPELLSWFDFSGNLRDDPEKEVPACRELLKERRLEKASVACGIEDPSLKIRRLDLPRMSPYDLKEAVRWQLRDLAEGSIDTYAVRYAILDEYASGDVRRLSVMGYMVKREVVFALVDLIKRLSLRPSVIEPLAVSLLAAFDATHDWKKGEACGLVELGASKSLFVVGGERKLLFSRPLPGISLAEAGLLDPLSEASGFARAERGGVGAIGGPPQADRTGPPLNGKDRATALTTFFSNLAIEIQRSMDSYSLLFHKERMDRLYLSGGGSLLPDLADHLTKNLGVPTELYDPIREWKQEGPAGGRYSVALGLALFA